MGIREEKKHENARLNKNRSKWEKDDWCHYFKEVKENTQKGQRYWGAGEVDRGWKGKPWDNKKKRVGMAAREKKEQERKTLDKTTLCMYIICTHICMYPCMHVCMNPCMHVCMYVSM